MLDLNEFKEMTNEKLLEEHNLYKQRIYSGTTHYGRTNFYMQNIVSIEEELDKRDIAYSKLQILDLDGADWYNKLTLAAQKKFNHIIIDPEYETEKIGHLIRSSLQNGRDPSSIMLHLPNGDALQLNDLDDEKAVEVLNALFGLEMTAEEYSSNGKSAKYFTMEESPVIYEHVMMSTPRKNNPQKQLKTVKQPFYRQLEKKKWY